MALLGDGDVMPNLLRDYGIIHSHTFGTLSGFMTTCQDFFADLMEGDVLEKSQYLGFTHVRMSDISSIDGIRNEVPKMTILYDSVDEVLILKFMVGVTHETCVGLLQVNFIEAVRARVGHIYSIYPLKSARFRGTQRMKEADASFKPRSRNLESDWPSIVFEVGVSEDLSQLQQDARFWLECSGEQTRIVIIANVNTRARTIVIERWQGAHPQLASTLQAAPTLQPARNVNNPNMYSQRCIPTRMQSLTLRKGRYYADASLTIPASLVFDVLPLAQGPPWGPTDFEITSEMLHMMNEMFWDGLH